MNPPPAALSDALTRLEDQMTKIRNMTNEAALRLVGPMPECVDNAPPTQVHVMARVLDLEASAGRIANDLETFVHQL